MKILIKSASKFLALYIIFIFSFTVIYRFCLTDSFYQANPETDPSYETEIEELLVRICNHLKRGTAVVKNKSCYINLQNEPIVFKARLKDTISDKFGIGMGFPERVADREITSIQVKFNKFEGNYLYFNIYHHNRPLLGDMGNGEGDGDFVRINLNNFEHSSNVELEILKPSSQTAFFGPAFYPEDQSLTEYLSRRTKVYLDPIFHYQLKPPILVLVNRVHDPFFYNLKSFLIEKRPHKETSFLKMLYFSAVTIATTGYTDIIPVSWPARLLTILEAMIGIITLGFMGARLYELYMNIRTFPEE